MTFFDLASLTKALVTAPLALEHLDLDRDRRRQLGFTDRAEPLTVRQLLSHSSGLPPWLPYLREPLADQLRRGFPTGGHPLLRAGKKGTAVYSDLGYRLLAELLEAEQHRPFPMLGRQATGLVPAPWEAAPVAVPDGPDAEAWALAAPEVPLPLRKPNLPHDANARAGMRGHAGFGGTSESLKAWLARWVAAGFPVRMALDTAAGEEGEAWGLGLRRVPGGRGRFGELLAQLPGRPLGIHLAVAQAFELPLPAPRTEGPAHPTEWWFHLGYTGGALFVRPTDGSTLLLLAHRRGPAGELLDAETLRARRWALLETLVARILSFDSVPRPH